MSLLVLNVTLTSVTLRLQRSLGANPTSWEVYRHIYCINVNYETGSSPFVAFLCGAASVLSNHRNEPCLR